MKYLYLIFRLFFCGHKYDKVLLHGSLMDSGYSQLPVGHYYNKECRKCGKIKKFSC